ncbi:hypothetical protein BH10PAT1_BH10PAT1_0100 [soil metagenome]
MVERKSNQYLNSGITPEKCMRLKRMADLAQLMYGSTDELTEDLRILEEGCVEGFYDPETMTWKDPNGGEHSQRCNAREISDGKKFSAPDGTIY